MKKNILKIPDYINTKLDTIVTDYISVSVAINLKSSDFSKPQFSNLKFQCIDGKPNYIEEFIPNISNGKYSKKNVNGYKGKPLKDLPKVIKKYYAGQRHYFGNPDRDTFSLYITRKVWQRKIYEPKEWSIVTELIKAEEKNGDNYYSLKVSIDQMFYKRDSNFKENLLFALNLLLENIGSFDIYSSEATNDDYLKTTIVNWELFPSGERENAINCVKKGIRISIEKEQFINDRADFLGNMEPKEFIVGTCMNKRYFGAKFSDKLVVFENIKYGNAIYVLFDNWEAISKLSRTQIMQLPNENYIRIPHRKNWQDEVKAIIRNLKNQN